MPSVVQNHFYKEFTYFQSFKYKCSKVTLFLNSRVSEESFPKKDTTFTNNKKITGSFRYLLQIIVFFLSL